MDPRVPTAQRCESIDSRGLANQLGFEFLAPRHASLEISTINVRP